MEINAHKFSSLDNPEKSIEQRSSDVLLNSPQSLPQGTLRKAVTKITENTLTKVSEERITRLTNAIESGKETRGKWLRAFATNATQQIIQRGAGIVWYDHERFALKSFFIDKDIQQANNIFIHVADWMNF